MVCSARRNQKCVRHTFVSFEWNGKICNSEIMFMSYEVHRNFYVLCSEKREKLKLFRSCRY